MSDLRRRLDRLSPERRRVVEQRLAERVATQSGPEPIAIVGMACRFPGAASPDALWELVRRGEDAIGSLPPARLSAEGWDAITSVSAARGGFLADVARFDAAFFEISPREAEHLDPQQRLLLEIAWEAFEAAGMPLEQLTGSDTGVFVGAHSHSNDYAWIAFDSPERIGPFTATGTAHNLLAGRVSYFFDLRGPSLVVDTACSSSLVAVHLACQSLRSGECRTALAGGVNLILTPHFTVAASQMNMLAADGRCKPFDARADGFGRSEGCGAVVLKRLSTARADGDRILAIILGTAVNQDGRTNGITAPSGRAQEQVIERALANAGVSPDRVSYVEAHGTGTPLGDPIEAESLVNVLGRRAAGDARCWIGSVKANLGHLEGAAGVAGLIKTVLGLVHRTVPPLAQFTALNPQVSLGHVLSVPATCVAWTPAGSTRVAGVSAFGWSGTNAHVVVEEAADPAVTTEQGPPALVHVLPLSARDADALTTLASSYAEALTTTPARDLVWSCATRRSHLDHRLAIIGRTQSDLVDRLTRFVESGTGPFVATGAKRITAAGLTFVFPGQGSQWPAMGQELLQSDAVAREALDACDAAARPYLRRSLLDLLRRPEGEGSHRIDIVQPLLFAMSVALAARWRAWGIEPDAVVGHSMGEAAAAHVAGALSLEDATRVICIRSAVMRQLTGRGAMALVDMPADGLEARIRRLSGELSIAAVNGPRTTVVAGDADVLNDLLRQLTGADVFCRPIRVDVASHCAQVDSILPTLRAELRDLKPRPTTVPMYSTVTGDVLRGETLDAEYWVRNLREPVCFASAVAHLLDRHHRRFVEISPHPILRDAVIDTFTARNADAIVVGSLERDQPACETLAHNLAALFVDGVDLEWSRVVDKGRFVSLPAYPWRRQRFWAGGGQSRSTWASTKPDRLRSAAATTFELSWRELPVPVPSDSIGRILVIGDNDDASALVSAAQRRGVGAYRVGVDLLRDGMDWLSEGERAGERASVVFVALPQKTSLDTPWPALERLLAETLDQFVSALKTVVDHSVRCALWTVTRRGHAVAAGGEAIEPIAASLIATARVAWDEHPDIAGGTIDLGDELGRETADAVIRHLLSAAPPRQTAFRLGRWLAPQLVPSEKPSPRARIRADATYVVTGGFGGIGLAMARRLVERGARHLALVGRRGLPPREEWSSVDAGSDIGHRIDAVRALERFGATVRIVEVDVADGAALRAALMRVEAEGPRIAGVIHAAATVHDRLLEQTVSTEFIEVARPKAGGAWYLQQYFVGRALDFFVICSSLGALIGLTGQAAYAASNAFVDALAHALRRGERPATSINWGGWKDVGLARASTGAATTIDALAKDGIEPFDTQNGLDAFERVVGAGLTQAAVMSVDQAVLSVSLRRVSESPLFERIAVREVGSAERPWPVLRQRLLDAAIADRRGLLSRALKGELSDVLRVREHEIDDHAPLGSLGLESLMGLELHRRLETSLGERLPKTLVWRHPTVAALTAFLLDRLQPQPVERRIPAAVDAPSPGALGEREALAALLNLEGLP